MANEVEREREREKAFLDRQVELDKTLKRIQEREKRIQEQEKRIQEREEEYRLSAFTNCFSLFLFMSISFIVPKLTLHSHRLMTIRC
jgi:hypothetical protein